MNEREYYLLIRKRKKIKLWVIAKHLNCSIAHLSKYETFKSDMSPSLIRGYKHYIDQYKI
ncbi:XRE family transcriptional regulator [Guptibacillus hwajinpoensis]|uniref:XRE family transcriptional regulator n=1 Tax=Guptibacillus hwajinpoensis TaxID=208199 RepID=UPI003734D721